MLFIDISTPIHPGMTIYPGNQKTVFSPITKPSGSQLTVITFDSHTGTHIDAPSHAALPGDIEGFALNHFYGPCRVIEILNKDTISVDDLIHESIQPGDRILFKTDNSLRGFEVFHETWVTLSPEAAVYLADQNVALVGIDWLGIKQKNAPNNIAHTAFLEKNIPILEGINLAEAEKGEYILSAFPIALQGVDGAPTRAVLIKS